MVFLRQRDSKILMANQKEGMTLIECMIYCTLLAWMGMLVAQLGHRYVRLTQSLGNQSKLMADVCVAGDLLARDVASAMPQGDSWRLATGSNLIFSVNNRQIGWTVTNNQLVRFVGIYDAASDKWHSYSRSLTLDCVEDVSFTIKKSPSDNVVNHVTLELLAKAGHQNCLFKRRFFLRNGVVL